MTKKIVITSVAIGVMLILIGCGGGSDETASSSGGNDGTTSSEGGSDEATTTGGDSGDVLIVQTKFSKSIDYDLYGRVVKEDLGDGKYIEYIYDDSGNLIKQNVVK